MLVGRVGLAVIGVGVFAEVIRHPERYPSRQAAFGREPHWAVDLAFFNLVVGVWIMVPSRKTRNCEEA